MLAPRSTTGILSLPVFPTSFLDWKLGLPWNDGLDAGITPGCMWPPLNIHTVAITADDELLFVKRGTQRMSWPNTVLGFHSWGLDIDRGGFLDALVPGLTILQGNFLFEQSQRGVLREFNPNEANLLEPEDVDVQSATCLTLHIRPMDFGWHICFVARIAREAKQLLWERGRYPLPESGRIEAYSFWPFNEKSMVEFFDFYAVPEGIQDVYSTATTTEPAIIMACVQAFGRGFLSKLPFECKVNH